MSSKKKKPMSEKKRRAQATLYVPFLTNGDVEDFKAAGFLPILRWVEKERAFSARPKLHNTDDLRVLTRRKRRAAEQAEKKAARKEARSR